MHTLLDSMFLLWLLTCNWQCSAATVPDMSAKQICLKPHQSNHVTLHQSTQDDQCLASLVRLRTRTCCEAESLSIESGGDVTNVTPL
jgi:hypothetical protein